MGREAPVRGTMVGVARNRDSTPVVPERDPVMLLQPRQNRPTNTTINVTMAARAMDSLVKGTLGEPPSPS